MQGVNRCDVNDTVAPPTNMNQSTYSMPVTQIEKERMRGHIQGVRGSPGRSSEIFFTLAGSLVMLGGVFGPRTSTLNHVRVFTIYMAIICPPDLLIPLTSSLS